MITVKTFNASYFKIYADASILEELKDHFSFRPPNYKWSPKFKEGIWDGYIRCFSPWSKLLYVGLLQDLQSFAQSRSYPIEFVDDFFTNNDNFSEYEAKEFIANLKLPFEPRPHQLKAFIEGVRRKRLLILSPTSSGKSLVIYLLTRYYNSLDLPVLIIVPSITLVKQMKKDFGDYGYDGEMTTIAEGSEKNNKRMATVSTWQSIYKLPEKWFEPFGVIIGDEAHEYDASCVKGTVEKGTKALFRFGLTGTLDGAKTHEMVLKGLFGPIFKVSSTKELMEKGIVADLKVKSILLKHSKLLVPPKIKTYQEEIDYLVKSEKRNAFIGNLALSLKGNTLILYSYIDKQGVPLGDYIRSKPSDKVLIEIRGEVDGETRMEYSDFIENNENVIITATYGVLSRGVNIKNIHNLIFAHPFKGKIRHLQSIGRILRFHENKKTATVYDIADKLTGKNVTYQQYIERLATYASESFPYKQYNVELK